MTGQKVRLTGKEKSELWFEGAITVVLLLLLNLAVVILVKQAIASNLHLQNSIWSIKNVLTFGADNRHIWSWRYLFVGFLGLVDVIVVYWRLLRRYRQMQMRHVIAELHYIADGHLDHRVSFAVSTDLQKVIDSINALVDSTVKAMAEERKIEQSKDELISNVSHDLRTPLTSIIGYLGLIENRQYQNEAELVRYAHTAFLKAKQMNVLVNDLFEYTKVRQPSAPLTLVDFNMMAMLEQLAASFELEAGKVGIDISVAGPESIIMTADTEKLGRVFNNLISNALKYGQTATKIMLSAQTEADEVVITVANDGQQIPEAALGQLFDRFFRVEDSRSQATGGTGLGLAIAQSIVELHGGYIEVTSSAALTCFIIHLPKTGGTKLKRK